MGLVSSLAYDYQWLIDFVYIVYGFYLLIL